MTYALIVVPENAVIPEGVTIPISKATDIIGKIHDGAEHEVITHVNTRELQLLVEYRDLFPIEIRAVIGLAGSIYNTIWNTYVSTMKRVTIDNLIAESAARNDEMSDAGQNPVSTPEFRRRSFEPLKAKAAPIIDSDDDSDIGNIE